MMYCAVFWETRRVAKVSVDCGAFEQLLVLCLTELICLKIEP